MVPHQSITFTERTDLQVKDWNTHSPSGLLKTDTHITNQGGNPLSIAALHTAAPAAF